MRRIRHVIWDFNGTLLDDVDCCVASLNQLLAKRAMQPSPPRLHAARADTIATLARVIETLD